MRTVTDDLKHNSGKHVREMNTPLYPTFIVKIGRRMVYVFFLLMIQNIGYGYSLESPRLGGFNMYPQSMF